MKSFLFLLFFAALICSGANLPEKLPSAADSERLLKLGQDHQFGSNGHPRDFAKAAVYYRQAYEQGNAAAAWHLAMLYYSGSGVEKNLAKAFELTSFAAKNGCAWANVSLAGMYINGIGCTKDPAAGFACYLKAAQAGIPGGYGGAGWCLIFGIGTEIDIPRGVEYYRKAADKFDPVAMYTLAGWYYYGQFVRQDKKKADLFYRLLRRQWSSIYYANNAGILFQRGIMCRFGQGGDVDLPRTRELWLAACQNGDTRAVLPLTSMLFNGQGGEKEPAKAIGLLERAAPKSASAKFILAKHYSTGIHLEKDPAKAAVLTAEALKAVDMDSVSDLGAAGLAYLDGIGVKRDPVLAQKYFRKLVEKIKSPAAHGVMYQQLLLGHCYYFGRGVEKNHSEAKKLWCSAINLIRHQAECEESSVMVIYAIMQQHGWGVPRSAENSRQLLLRAFALNDTDAAFMLYEFYRDGIGGEKSPAEAQKYLEYAARRLCYPAVQELKKQQK